MNPYYWKCEICEKTFYQRKGESFLDFQERIFDNHTAMHIVNKEYPGPRLAIENFSWNQKYFAKEGH